MKNVEIVSAKNGRIRLKTHKAYHKSVFELLKNTLKDTVVSSNPYTSSITIIHTEEVLRNIKRALKENGFSVINKSDSVNFLFAAQLILNVGGGLEGVAFSLVKDVILDKIGLGAISYFI